jgi:hypothetical protein
MMCEGGLPRVLAAVYEVNPFTLAAMAALAMAHEATAIADVWIAFHSRRRLTQYEQHVRSFLEIMPFGMIPLMVLLHRPIGKDLRLVRRSPFLSRDFAYLGVLIVAGGILPYGEELARCARAHRIQGNATYESEILEQNGAAANE